VYPWDPPGRFTDGTASLPESPAMGVVAVVNRKGGVGKTTTAVSVAAALALTGHRTLLVDLDPQGSAGRSLAIDVADGRGSSALFAAKG